MSDQGNRTYVRETRTTESSGAGMALIVGGLVVAVGFIIWLVFGGLGPVATTGTTGDTTTITVETPAAPAADAVVEPTAPAEGTAAPAPVEE